MAKMTLDDLRKLRSKVQSDLKRRDSEGKSIQVIVGMGTCGIASGAKLILDKFITLLNEKGIAENAIIRQTGCMGHCENEPTVEIIMPDMPKVFYGNVKENTVERIVEEHIINKKPVEDFIIAK
ncbi:MAG: (2Fe-2S) ferredoxin domain-containing protein [Treponemataceae bacterium]|nr:(2Fe-2S) ferredoxin domain-containing protein [Treponemataceae bacterium]